MSELEENAEWARLIYRSQIDLIEAVKRRQWTAINYILLIFAAIIGFVKVLNNPCTNQYTFIAYFLLLVSWGISIVGIYHLIDMHIALTKYRKKVFNIAEKDEYEFVREIDLIADEEADFSKYFWSITALFVGMVLAGLTLVTIFLTIFLAKSFTINSLTIPLHGWLIILLGSDSIITLIFYCKARKKINEFEKKLKTKPKKRNG